MKTKCVDCKESSTGRCKKHRIPKKSDLKSKQKPDQKKKGQQPATNTNLEYAIAQAYEGLRRMGHAPMVSAGMVSAIMNTGCDLSEVLRLTEDAAKKFGDTK